MPEKSCPEHPDSDSMVPCLGCGKSFCRICTSPRGAGQYCQYCYEESVANLSRKSAGGVADRFRGLATHKEKAGPGAGAGGRTGPAARFAGISRDKRPAKPAAAEPSNIWERADERVIAAARWLAVLPVGAAKRTAVFAGEHFPFCLRETSRGEAMPAVARSWYKLVPLVIGGAGLWTVIVAVVHRRTATYSALVALVIAAGVVWALGLRFDIQTAIVTAMLVVLALVLGELAIQLLYRAHVIKTLAVSGSDIASSVYRRYFSALLVWRLLPAFAIGFLVGWWPPSMRIGWRGFALGARRASLSARAQAVSTRR